MKRKLQGLLTAMMLGGVMIGAQGSYAASAKLSPGCQLANSLELSQVMGGVGFPELFYKGEQITFTAGAPDAGEPLTLVAALGGLSGPNAVSVPYPGSVTLTIPKRGEYLVQAVVNDSTGAVQGATFDVSCSAGS